jgi:hypothetical protein
VRVEELPWAIGKHQLTKAYMLFLAHWRRLWSSALRKRHVHIDRSLARTNDRASVMIDIASEIHICVDRAFGSNAQASWNRE